MAAANRRSSQHSQRAGRRSLVLSPSPAQPYSQSAGSTLQLLTKTFQADTSLSGTGYAVVDNGVETEAFPDLFVDESFPSNELNISPDRPRKMPQPSNPDFSSYTQANSLFSSSAQSNYGLVQASAGSQHLSSSFPCAGGDPWNPVCATETRTLAFHHRQEPGSHASHLAVSPSSHTSHIPLSVLSSPPLNSVYYGSSQQDVQSVLSTPATASMDLTYFSQHSYDQGPQIGVLPDFDGTHDHDMDDTNALRLHDTINYEIHPSPEVRRSRARQSAAGLVAPKHICQWQNCGKDFKTHSLLKKHVKSHKKEHRCRFADCDRATTGFATTNDCDRHERSVHKFFAQGSNIKVYKCAVPDCKSLADGKDKIWPRLDNFKQHCTRMHTDIDVDEIVAESEIETTARPGGEYPQQIIERPSHEQGDGAMKSEDQLSQDDAMGIGEATFAAQQQLSAQTSRTQSAILTQHQPPPRHQRRPSVSTTATSESRKRPRQPDNARPRTPSFGPTSNTDTNNHYVPMIQDPRYLSPTTPHRRSFGGQSHPQYMPANPHLHANQQTYPTPPSTQHRRTVPHIGLPQRMARSVSHQGDELRSGHNPRVDHQSFQAYPQYSPSFPYLDHFVPMLQQSPDQIQPADQDQQPFDASWTLPAHQAPMFFGSIQQRPYTIACDQFPPDLTPNLPEAVTVNTAHHSEVVVGINPDLEQTSLQETMLTDDMTPILPASPHTPALDMPVISEEPPAKAELDKDDTKLLRYLRQIKSSEIQSAVNKFMDQQRVSNGLTESSSHAKFFEDSVEASSSTPSSRIAEVEVHEQKSVHARKLSQPPTVAASSDGTESIAPSELIATTRTGKGKGRKNAGGPSSSSHRPSSAISSGGTHLAQTPLDDAAALVHATASAKNRARAGKSNFTCDLCKKKIGRESELKKHRKRHFGPYSCVWDGCQSRSGSKSDWSRHEENKHGVASVGGWRCDGRHEHPEQEVDGATGQLRKCYQWWPVQTPTGATTGDYEQVKTAFRQHLLDAGAAQLEHSGYANVNTLSLRDGHVESVAKVMQKCWIPEAARGAFWCGFCDKIIEVEPDECKRIKNISDQGRRDVEWRKQRLNHIETHFDIQRQRRGTNVTCRLYKELGGCGKMKMEMDWFNLAYDQQRLVGVTVAAVVTAPALAGASDDGAGASDVDSGHDDGGVSDDVAVALRYA